MKKKIVVALLSLAIACLLAPTLLAQPYYVSSYSYIQHRVYEDGRGFYRLSFALSNTLSCSACYVRDGIVDRVEIWAGSSPLCQYE
ncbi:MAG TPA: hypothetical protein VMU60_00460 [Syntrophobacteria bacterium]|nr:hypothetical protein [Syntrophobacteria bacterium]